MTTEQQKRVLQAMDETQRMLEKLETAYNRRPEHLRTDDDRNLINFHRKHIIKLTDILDGRPRNQRSMTASEFRALRQRLGMTQEQLAKEIDVTSRSIKNYENEAYKIPRVVELAMHERKLRTALVEFSKMAMESTDPDPAFCRAYAEIADKIRKLAKVALRT